MEILISPPSQIRMISPSRVICVGVRTIPLLRSPWKSSNCCNSVVIEILFSQCGTNISGM